MVTLLLDSTQLEVVLSLTEHALSFRKQNVVIERSQISRVQLTDDAWTWLRGVPDPGTYVPVAVAMGSWKSAGGRDFAIIRRRKPSVVIDLEGHPEFQRVILTTRNGLALIQALRLDTGAEAQDVADLATATPPAAGTGRARKPKPTAAPA
ncbi:hypothetical protein [Microbacterium sp.]|uniref:hypothetical protein n=1 Tax=Microbacterium sp. TaxID=51671 RepID=UPI00092830C3|nr:hypothetical protein [Microbacterium sp.]OJU69097.1 MAG: hypothetical protein BGO04_13385 [Microbacterium sp. 70-38]MBN9170015.1 hypothetical protein [Microbacterium sp.]MBN9184348.1 hypothetical protein [Microbacterium sp.]MBN9189668.1 hypothetical protein [Microbacterium sp.]MBN9193623.1 hypothetical protein [Microbacterium sp.]